MISEFPIHVQCSDRLFIFELTWIAIYYCRRQPYFFYRTFIYNRVLGMCMPGLISFAWASRSGSQKNKMKSRCFCETLTMPPVATKSKQLFLDQRSKSRSQGHWPWCHLKGHHYFCFFSSGVCMPNMKSLPLTVQKS